jgi:hypothetical protein
MMKKIFLIFSLGFVLLTSASFVVAASGSIDSNAKYAWSSNIGWINFAPLDNQKKYLGLEISDTDVRGYAWSQNLGWINFAPKNGGVLNNQSGRLSGDAFGENIGWINFNGVSINCDGKLVGEATGENVGKINFNCSNCTVKTNWLPSSCNKKNHSECNAQKQCIFVAGAGENQCQSDTDCQEVLPVKPQEPNLPTSTVAEKVAAAVLGTVTQIKNIINTPLGSLITKAISTTSLAGGALAVALISASANVSLFDVLLFPLRFLGIVMTALGLKKRTLPWGVVYDSVTKQPLDPAYVVLRDLQGQDAASAVTDLDGRYGFLVQPGSYTIVANKTNYAFPSQKLAGKFQDETYGNLYFGGPLDIQKAGEVITKNIPLDPVKFDWNEFAKRNKRFMKFYSRWDAFLRRITDVFFVVGFAVAFVAFIFAPYPYNTIIFGLYLLVLLLRVLGLKPKAFGYVEDQLTGDPLSFALIKIIMPTTNTEIAHRVADKYGRYYCLVPKGKYYVKIEKKNADASYTLVHTSAIIDASKNGIIKKKFLV